MNGQLLLMLKAKVIRIFCSLNYYSAI